MKKKIMKWVRVALFILGGALAGFGYYHFFGCTNGCNIITSSPVNTMIFMGLVGLFLSGIFGEEAKDKCNM